MSVSAMQRTALEEVMHVITHTIGPPRKRQLAQEFLELVDREDWPQYYEVIPEPRCLNNILSNIEKNRYRDCLDAYTDISLVFWNAMYYNEETSQIAKDAQHLKGVLDMEWKRRPVLPAPRSASPPPSSAQKVHAPKDGAASTAGASTSQQKLPKPRSKQHQSTPEVDVDIDMDDIDVDISGSTPEPETEPTSKATTLPPQEAPAVPGDFERDAESEQIISALERGLPLWSGFGEEGWIEDPRIFTPERMIDIVHVIKTHKDVIGNRVAIALEAVPEDVSVRYASAQSPLSLKTIETRARTKLYTSPKEFDRDMILLFEKARRWHEPCSDSYGSVLLLQRFYQALTSSNPPYGPPYASNSNFAALPIGPGNAKPVHGVESSLSAAGASSASAADLPASLVPAVTSYRIPTRDRTFVDEVVYKGWYVRCADWVHLSNADDPSRPIVAQVWKCWTSEETSKKGEPGITVCWYYRPEQTFHTADKRFWQGEVFKTSHFADHPMTDLVEKIAVQFTARHIRGRPRPPYWYPGFPLYVCDQRFNDRERVFVKIKNWNSCVPEEVRKSDAFMPIYPFERTVWPPAGPSPFLKSSRTGRGGSTVKWPGGLVEGSAADGEKDKKGGGALRTGDTRALNASSSQSTAVGNGARPIASYQPSALAQPYAPTNGVPGVPGLPYAGQRVPLLPQDRSIIIAAGALASGGHAEKLPAETAKHFDRDPETNEVLWFSASPMNMTRTPAPTHSLAYLNFLATKRKREKERVESLAPTDPIDVDEEPEKKRRFTVLEKMNALLADISK